MLNVAWKGVLARKLRLVLTSVAVVLGVGMVSGAFFLTDSLRSSFDTLFTEAAQGIDVQVQGTEYKRLVQEQLKNGPASVPIDLAKVGAEPELADRIKDVSGVKAVAGSVFELGAQPLDKHGKPIGGGGAPTFAANWVPEATDIGALRITKGRAPKADEVMLDEVTLKRGKYHVGDKVRVLIQGGRKSDTFRISGAVRFGSSGNLNGASITVFQTARVQQLLDMGDRFTAIEVQARSGVTQETLKRRIKQRLGADYDVITGEEFTQEQTDSIDTSFLSTLQSFILGFAAVAVFVGAFVIFNTFTILVGQRTREFGLLRAIGAGRRQIMGIVAIEAFVTGLVASTLGIVTGFGLANLLRAIINHASGGGFPDGPFTLAPRTVIASYAVGLVVTMVACIVPAWRASRLSPLEALRTNSALAGRGWKAPAVGTVMLLVGGGLVGLGFSAGDDASVSHVLSSIGGGFAIAIIGIALLSRIFIVPVTKVFALVLGHGTAGRLATGNVLRNRARSATTASALMIGLALASLVLVFYASLQATIDHQIDEVLGADITVFNTTTLSSGIGTVEQSTVDEMRRTKGVDQVAGQRLGGSVIGRKFDAGAGVQTIVAFDDGAVAKGGIVELNVTSGTSRPGSGVVVDTDLAKEEHLEVGDRLQLAFSGGRAPKLTVRGIFKPNEVVGGSIISSVETFDANQPPSQRAPSAVYVRVDDGVSPRTVVKRLEHDLGTDADFLEIKDSEALRDTFRDQVKPILYITLGMLALSLIIALFGIANTLALNVFERTREIGLIRAVGGTRWQLRWTICIEAVFVALFGALVGVAVGLGAGRAMISALADEGFVFAGNTTGLLWVLFGGLLAGLLASVLPARRAARTDILRAIASE